jgi:hypothetical protein
MTGLQLVNDSGPPRRKQCRPADFISATEWHIVNAGPRRLNRTAGTPSYEEFLQCKDVTC